MLHCVYRCFDWIVIKCSGLIPTPLAVPPSQPDVSGIATHFNNLCRVCCAESFSPQPCPFLDAYTFSYNNNTGGPCRQPVSTATPCSSQSQYRLHFQHCSAYAHTYDRGTPAQQQLVSLFCFIFTTSFKQFKIYTVEPLTGPVQRATWCAWAPGRKMTSCWQLQPSTHHCQPPSKTSSAVW